jgi:predicted metalloendopeptidase
MNFDGNGMMRSWWSRQSEAKYVDKSNCFVRHYARQTVTRGNLTGARTVTPGERRLAVNAKLSLGENMSDNGGLKLAKEAYDIWRNATGITGQGWMFLQKHLTIP